MEFSFARDIRNQRNEVESRFKSGMLRTWPDLSPWLIRMEGDATWEHLPTMTLIFYQHLGVESPLASAMAGIFKNLYFAQSIHSGVKDDEEGQEYNQELQFSILIGDYIYGYVLKLLLDHQVVHLLPTFADMIADINEGLVRKHRLASDPITALQETKAPLYAAAFQTAAELSEKREADIYSKLGRDLGMAIELLHLGLNSKAHHYIHTSFEILSNYIKHPSGGILEKAVHEMYDRSCARDRAAVI